MISGSIHPSSLLRASSGTHHERGEDVPPRFPCRVHHHVRHSLDDGGSYVIATGEVIFSKDSVEKIVSKGIVLFFKRGTNEEKNFSKKHS